MSRDVGSRPEPETVCGCRHQGSTSRDVAFIAIRASKDTTPAGPSLRRRCKNLLAYLLDKSRQKGPRHAVAATGLSLSRGDRIGTSDLLNLIQNTPLKTTHWKKPQGAAHRAYSFSSAGRLSSPTWPKTWSRATGFMAVCTKDV